MLKANSSFSKNAERQMGAGRFFALRLLALLALALLLAPSAYADDIPPGDVSVQAIAYHPTHNELREGLYKYKIAWQGIPVAKAKIDINKSSFPNKPFFSVAVDARTAKGIDWAYRLRHHSKSFLAKSTFRPLQFYTKSSENRRNKVRKVEFTPEGVVKSRRWKNGKEIPSLEFVGSDMTLDPISGAFIAKSLPLAVGVARTFDVFNGKHRYLITFKVEGMDLLPVGKKMVRAFRIVPEVKKLTDTEGIKKLRSATLWVSDDSRRDLLRLESKLLLGSISAELVGFEPAPVQPPVAGALVEAKARPKLDSAVKLNSH